MTRRLPAVLLPDDLAEGIIQAASEDQRNVSDWVRVILAREIKRRKRPAIRDRCCGSVTATTTNRSKGKDLGSATPTSR
jgi:hypothetical protein